MISKNHRFHGYGSLNWAYQKAHKVSNPQITLKYIVNPKRSSYRVAVVVSKKVSKSAVVRNRIRRRIYEQVRLLDAQIQDSYDLIFSIYTADILELSPDNLRSLIISLLTKSRVISENPKLS